MAHYIPVRGEEGPLGDIGDPGDVPLVNMGDAEDIPLADMGDAERVPLVNMGDTGHVPFNYMRDTSPPEETTSSSLRQSFMSHQGPANTTAAAPASASTHESSKNSPLFDDLPYPVLSKESQGGLARRYESCGQLKKLLFWGLMRWLITAGWLGILGLTIWRYSTLSIISDDDRLWFNAILTGLSIVIGLAIASSLNAMTFNMRWWLLSLRKRPLRQVEAIVKSDILGVDSYILDPWIAGLAFFWLLVNVASQVAVACFSLEVSVDPTDSVVFLYPGTVSVADMSHFFAIAGSTAAPSYAAEEFTANIYGNFANSFLYQDSINNFPSPGSTYEPNETDVYYGRHIWIYPFLEAPPTSDSTLSIADASSEVYSNRSINSTYSCNSYTVNPISGNGSSNVIELFLNGSGSPATTLTLPPGTVAPNETTYYGPDNATCGPRCGYINVFQASYTTPQYYQCNITISEVANVSLPQHLVNDTFARLAARSIALGINSNEGFYQRYPAGSKYGTLFVNDPQGLGFQTAYFAIGALAIAYLNNPTINIPGMQPEAGFILNIHSNSMLILIFLLISGMQIVLFIISTFIAGNVIIVDDSPIAISRLFQPILTRLGRGGTILDGKEIAEALKKEDVDVLKNKEMKVIYTTKKCNSEGTRSRLVLGDGLREGFFMSGHYD